MRTQIDPAATAAGKEWTTKHKEIISLLRYFAASQFIEMLPALRVFLPNENVGRLMICFLGSLLPPLWSSLNTCFIDVKEINDMQVHGVDSWVNRPRTYSDTDIVLFLNDRALEKKIKPVFRLQLLTQCILIGLQYLAWNPSDIYQRAQLFLYASFFFGFTYFYSPFRAPVPTLRYQQGFQMILLMNQMCTLMNKASKQNYFSLIPFFASVASFMFLLLFLNEYRRARTSGLINEDRNFVTTLENHEREVVAHPSPGAIAERMHRRGENRRRAVINSISVQAPNQLPPPAPAAPAA